MNPEVRKRMGEQAVSLARGCGYQSTGTVEFLMDKNHDFYFLEMNTRLQVEHPITEEITGVDLVEQQLLIAAGHKLAFKQEDVKINGHAIELRVYAEDPSRKFLPSIGFLQKYKEPEVNPNIRIDTGVEEGSEISMYYDPMISKLITYGKDRTEAINLLHTAIDEYVIQGVTHNLSFGKSIITKSDFIDGTYTTAFIPDHYPNGFNGEPIADSDKDLIAIASAFLKNERRKKNRLVTQDAPQGSKSKFVTVKGVNEDDHDRRVRVDYDGEKKVTITDLDS
jgi:propionyl-CoA carboxylase alpha chain